MSDGAERVGSAIAGRRAQLGRYALWQARDYLFERGVPTLLLGALFGFFAFLGAPALREMLSPEFLARIPAEEIARHGSAEAVRRVMLEGASMRALRGMLGGIVFVGALFAMNGLVANDRKLGFYKFLFAKPLSPERYYGQAFVVHALGFLAAVLLLGAAWGVVVTPVLSRDIVIAMMLVYLCYAGIAFFLTAAAKWDWLSLVAVALVSTTVWEFYGTSTHPLAQLRYLLPPLPRTDSVYAAVTQQLPLPWPTLAWLTGYGVACYVAGLVVLHYRRLATP